MVTSRGESFIQFVKFGLVGVSNTAVNFAIYSLLVFWGMLYLLANFLAFSISVLNSFFWNNRYVFRLEGDQSRVWWKALMKSYACYSVTGIFLYSFLLWLLVDVCGISEYLAWLINIPISVPINFLLNKHWAYRGRKVS